MSKYVSKVNIANEDIVIKDAEAREKIVSIKKSISTDIETSNTCTVARELNDVFWINDDCYRAIDTINVGDTYTTTNCTKNSVLKNLMKVYGMSKEGHYGKVPCELYVGDTDPWKYESLVTGSSAISNICGQAPDGNIGVMGASSSSDNASGYQQYPIGVMGLAVGDDATKNDTISAGYMHMIRSAGNGASICLEMDCDVQTNTQDYSPNKLPDPNQGFASCLQLSNGGGDHTSGSAKELSTAISINKNPAKFKHGLVVTKGSVSQECICVPSNGGGRYAWYSDNVALTGDRPTAYIDGNTSGGYGSITIGLWHQAEGVYKEKTIDVNTLFSSPQFGVLTVNNFNFVNGNNTIDLSSVIPAGQTLLGITGGVATNYATINYNGCDVANKKVTFYNGGTTQTTTALIYYCYR